MFYTYVLRNHLGKLYIGYTNDLKDRFKRHLAGEVYTTKRIGGSWTLIYYEACPNQFDALRREKFLKTGRGRYFLQRRLNYSYPDL